MRRSPRQTKVSSTCVSYKDDVEFLIHVLMCIYYRISCHVFLLNHPFFLQNLPFDINNRLKLTVYFVIYFGSGFAVPFIALRHHLLKS